MVRVLQFGSEPLFDGVLGVDELAYQVHEARARLSSLHIPVTVSDLAYSYQKVSDAKEVASLVFILIFFFFFFQNGGAHSVISAVDMFDVHILPFFARDASTGPFLQYTSSAVNLKSSCWAFFSHSKKRLVTCSKGCQLVYREWSRKENLP